eukprot:gene9705-7572_t
MALDLRRLRERVASGPLAEPNVRYGECGKSVASLEEDPRLPPYGVRNLDRGPWRMKDMAREKVEDNSKMRISSPYISKSTTAEKRFPDPTTKTGGAPANKPPPALPGASKSRLAEGRRETVHRSVSEASNNYRQDQPATPCPKPKLDAGSGSQLTSSGNISRDTNSSAKEQNGQPAAIIPKASTS